MGEPVQGGSGQPLAAEDLGPVFEGQIGGHDQTLPFVGAADQVEEQLGPGLARRHVTELVERQRVLLRKLAAEARQRAVQIRSAASRQFLVKNDQ
jgi:hypothetical protein